MEIEPKARNFFALCQQLYVFFKRQFASNVYEGQTLKRLLVQRLTGHLQCTLAVKESRQSRERTDEHYAKFATKAGIPRAAKDAPSTKPRRTLTENKLLKGFLVNTTLVQQGSAQSSASQWD